MITLSGKMDLKVFSEPVTVQLSTGKFIEVKKMLVFLKTGMTRFYTEEGEIFMEE